MLEFAEHVAKLVHRRVVRGAFLRLREDLLQLVTAEIEFLQAGERRQRLVEDRTAAHIGRFLMQVPDPRALREGDAAGIGRRHSADDLEQRRLTRAVEADQTDPAVIRHGPAHVGKNLARAERLGDVVETKHD